VIADGSSVVDNAALVLGGADTIANLSGTGTITNGGFTLTVTQAAPQTYSGVMSGTGGLTKLGAAVLTLSGTNTYTGATTITAGGITTGAANVIADGSDVVDNAALVLGGAETIANLSGTGTVTNGGFTLTVTQAAPQTYSGVMSGTGGLTKLGAAVLTLSGTNTYSGATTITAGGITTGAANVIADGSSVVVNAPLVLGGGETIANLSGSSTITNGGFTLTVTQAADQTYSGVMSGVGGLTKAGAAALTLTGINTYTGATAVNAGTLSFNAINTGVSAVTVSNAATKLAGTGTIPGAVTMNAGTILAPGGTNGDLVGTLTINGIVTFNGASKYIVTMTGGAVDQIVAGAALTATGSVPTIEMQAGYSIAGVALPATVMNITGAYTAFDVTSLPAGFVIDAAKVGNLIRFTALPAAVVPTLNEWGIFITLILLTGAGVILMRRRQRTANAA